MTQPVEKHLLIVEDDLHLREAFRLLLEDAGYRVTEAGTAAQTLEAVHQEVPDLILLDLGLPDRSGLDVARELRQDPQTAGIVIVALTGHVGAAEKRECLAAGCTAYFAKPLSPSELMRKLPDLLA